MKVTLITAVLLTLGSIILFGLFGIAFAAGMLVMYAIVSNGTVATQVITTSSKGSNVCSDGVEW